MMYISLYPLTHFQYWSVVLGDCSYKARQGFKHILLITEMKFQEYKFLEIVWDLKKYFVKQIFKCMTAILDHCFHLNLNRNTDLISLICCM